MPDWGPIGRQVFERTYAREKEDGTRETFDEVVGRMVNGNLALMPEHVDRGERERLVSYISQLKLQPAGRHWWVSGVPGRQFLFNCHRAGWTDQLADHVEFTFDELMKGGGVGANYSADYMARMHRVRRRVWVLPFVRPDHPDATEVRSEAQEVPGNVSMITCMVEDSREGWVHAMGELCRLSQLAGRDIAMVVDVSDVRPRGSLIRGFGGRASGPGPLVRALSRVAETLRAAVGGRLSGLQCMTIDHDVASCVISGNVRRSARIAVMHWRDPDIMEFIKCKRDGGHWTANVSVEVDDAFWAGILQPDSEAQMILHAVAEGMLTNSEPGLFNSSLSSKGERGDVRCPNPCGEIALQEWENCNLGHVNLALVESDEEARECFGLMTRWLIRATAGDGMSWRQREVVNTNRRIGVGFLGLQEWLWSRHGAMYKEVAFAARIQDSLAGFYRVVELEAMEYSKQIGIPTPIKLTTVAPTGTQAKLAGVTEGMHAVYAKYFLRRVRYADGEAGLLEAAAQGLHVEPDLNQDHTWVVTYPCRDVALDRVPDNRLTQQCDVSVIELLGCQAAVQRHWADNAVSFTANVDEKTTPKELYDALRVVGPRLKGTTVMVEGSYEQAPIERITREQYEAHVTRFDGSDERECVTGCPIR